MYYYYKIESKINQNLYIGITTDVVARRNRHFNLLSKNKHFNPHLQLAYNKYGAENFVFSIIEEREYEDPALAYKYEQELIELYDSHDNGYNCNPGGFWTGPRGRFSKEEVFYIRSCCYFNKTVTGVIGKYFDCPSSTINNIRIGRNYKPWCEEFDKLSEQEKRQIYEDFCSISNFEILKFGKHAKGRDLTKDQIFIILYNDENKFTTYAEIRRNFEVGGDHRNTFQSIRKGLTYKDYFHEYKQLTVENKKELLCRYMETYK